MDTRVKVAIAVSQNYFTILDRRKRYARHVDTLNLMKPDIDMTEIPMAPRLVAYRKKSEDYRKSQKKLDDQCIAMLRKTYKEREMARRHQKRPGTTRDWIAELGQVRATKPTTPNDTMTTSKNPQLRPLRSQRTYRAPAAAKIIFPDDNEQITASEIYEPAGLEDGMQVTDLGPASSRSQRNNVSFSRYPVAPPSNKPKSARNLRNSGTIQEPSNDSSSRSKRKVLVSQTQTEPESQEYESDFLGENDSTAKSNTFDNTFESTNESGKEKSEKDESEKEKSENDESEKEKSEKDSEKEKSENDEDKEKSENDEDKEKSENNDSEKEKSENDESEKEKSENDEDKEKSEKEESENEKSENDEDKEKSENDEDEDKEKSENNESEKEDDMKSDFESTAKSDTMNSTMKSDFENDDDDEDNDKESKDDDEKDDDDDDDEKEGSSDPFGV